VTPCCPLCGALAPDLETHDLDMHTCNRCQRSWRQDDRGPVVLKTIATVPVAKRRDEWLSSVAGDAAQIGQYKTSKTFS